VKVKAIVVVDDGSTDSARAELEKICQAKGVYFLSLAHTGHPGLVRKAGVELLDTDWVAFLDSDDVWNSEKIEHQLSEAKRHSAEAICSMAENYPTALSLSLGTDAIKKIRKSDLLKANSIVCSSVLIRRELLQKVGGFASEYYVKGAEDYATWLRISDFTTWLLLPKTLLTFSPDKQDSLSQTLAIENKYPHVLAYLNYANWRAKQGKKYSILFRLIIKLLPVSLSSRSE